MNVALIQVTNMFINPLETFFGRSTKADLKRLKDQVIKSVFAFKYPNNEWLEHCGSPFVATQSKISPEFGRSGAEYVPLVLTKFKIVSFVFEI